MTVKGALIVFTGIDGSGKSTQAQLLTQRLLAKGVPVKYAWARWEPFFLKPASAILKKASHTKHTNCEAMLDHDSAVYRSRKSVKKRILSLPGVKSLWLLLAALDYYLQVRRKICRHLEQGTTVICDRYSPDFLADLAINFGCRGEELAGLSNHWLLKLFPQPRLAFYIDIPPEVGFLRKSDGTSREYLAERIGVYAQIAYLQNMKRLDGTLPIEEISDLAYAQLR